MNRKHIGLLIIILGIILILVILYIIFFSSRFSFNDFINNNDNNTVVTPPVNNLPIDDTTKEEVKKKATINIEKIKKDLIDVTEDDLKQMAASFAERFGSYSNQSNFGNIEDLKIFMTKKMQVWADNFVEEQRTKSQFSGIYYGITTKAVSEEAKTFDDDAGVSSIIVSTRRREASNTTNNTTNVFNQTIKVDFIKENGAWKVDSALWQN
jgi:hypothetical protein